MNDASAYEIMASQDNSSCREPLDIIQCNLLIKAGTVVRSSLVFRVLSSLVLKDENFRKTQNYKGESWITAEVRKTGVEKEEEKAEKTVNVFL